jgi:hypothetical protein
MIALIRRDWIRPPTLRSQPNRNFSPYPVVI